MTLLNPAQTLVVLDPLLKMAAPNLTEVSWSSGKTQVTLKHQDGNLARYMPLVDHALEINRPFFDQVPPKLLITIVKDEASWIEAAKNYGHIRFAWGVTLDNGDVVVKTPEYAHIEPSRAETVLNHEVNHSFWFHNFGKLGAAWSPFWVVEGLANLVAPARDLATPKEIAELVIEHKHNWKSLEFADRDLSGPDEVIFCYSLWRAITERICSDGGSEKLMKCLRGFVAKPTQVNFLNSFKAQFGCTLEDYFEDCLTDFLNRSP